MARRGKAPSHENHERWLISYADFITLLFAFFVVMFASSHADKAKARQVSASVQEAFERGAMPKALMDMMGRRRPPETEDPAKAAEKSLPDTANLDAATLDAARAALGELLPSLEQLSQSLAAEIADGKVSISMEPRGLVVSLKEAAFFPPAGDRIQDSALPVIEKIASSAHKIDNRILLEGHTDSAPIHNERFRSNWDLSAARAIAMLNLFSARFGVPVNRLSVAGYADTVPVADNATIEGRQKNRRVDVVFLNEYGLKSQPSAAPTPAKPSALSP
jgi:chemotaxis protein MotB